jgi:hypothetical protein
MRTINFGINLRFFQIKPIKTAEFRFMQFGKQKGKTLHHGAPYGPWWSDKINIVLVNISRNTANLNGLAKILKNCMENI